MDLLWEHASLPAKDILLTINLINQDGPRRSADMSNTASRSSGCPASPIPLVYRTDAVKTLSRASRG